MNNTDTMEAFFGALECRLSSEYHRDGYRGSFQDYLGSRMCEIMDILVPSVCDSHQTSFDKDSEIKEAFDSWFHNKFKFDHSSEKTNMLTAWRAAQEVYQL